MKNMIAYAATYTDRGEKLTAGRGAIKTQLDICRRFAEDKGGTITLVAIDVIVGKNAPDSKIERLTAEAERLAHEAFADTTDELTFYIAGLRAKSRTHDPRDDDGSARSLAIEAVGKAFA